MVQTCTFYSIVDMLQMQGSDIYVHVYARWSGFQMRVDKPHPASVPGTRLAVAGCSRKEIVKAVWNSSGVTDRNYWKFSQDTFNGNDIENWFLVVRLV